MLADSRAPSIWLTARAQSIRAIAFPWRHFMKVYSYPAIISFLLTALFRIAAPAQMVDPGMDNQPGPFSYFGKPTDEIGTMYATSAAELTPEGFLYTGFGELMFFVGPEQNPISARIRTLEDGYLPVFSYTVIDSGIEYRFTVFAASVEGGQGTTTAVNFVRVTMNNPGDTPHAAFLSSGIRYQAIQTTEKPTGDNRFVRPIQASGVGQFHQPGETFSKHWIYSQSANAFLRDGRVLYLFPQQSEVKLSLTLRSHYNRVQQLKPTVLDVQPTTPTDVAAFTVQLGPGKSKSLDFKMPLEPIKMNSPEFSALDKADFDLAHAEVNSFWKELIGRGMSIHLAESKVTETFNASLVYCLMALNSVDGQAVQTVNQFQYHRFYLRDSADFVRMYDATGYSDIANQVLPLFFSRQQSDGNFLSQPGQYDGWGEALWSFGDHFRRTHDLAFAQTVFPMIVRAVDWLEKARAADPLHIMPMSDVKDNEYVAAHLVGYNFLALDGLKAAISIASATGHEKDAQRFHLIYEDYRICFLKLLDQAAQSEAGYIPPSLDGGDWKGTDWGNLLSVTPEPVLDAHDPRVTATLKHMQANYQEGIATYTEPEDGQYLHHYLTIKNTLTELVRGEQQQAIRELYAELLHTSSTHAGFEYAIRPWGSRDFEGNLAPHGWFAADYRNLLRNMMLREEGDDLHLFSAVAPEWIGPGKSIRVEHAPSTFGAMDFSLDMSAENSAILNLKTSFPHPPRKMILHLPWFMDVTSVIADGVSLHVTGDAVELPSTARRVLLDWKRRKDASEMSYERTVQSYKAEYRRRYEHLLSSGEMSPSIDTWRVPEH